MDLSFILTVICILYLNGSVLIQSYRLYKLKSSYEISLPAIIGLPIAESVALYEAFTSGELIGTIGYGVGLVFHTIFTYTVLYYRFKNKQLFNKTVDKN